MEEQVSPAQGGDALLEVSGLSRRFGETEALQGLVLRVGAGELYGLVGPDGAGKTTAIRIIAGLLDPDAGCVRVLGHAPDAPPVRELLGYMPQQYSLYGDLSVDENLHFFARLFALSREDERARRTRLLEVTRLAPFVERRADALSGGMYKKLALACALLHRPRLLLLDEPTNGVDPVSRRELWALLHEFLAEGMGIVVCTPYMDEAERCHRVGLLDGGRLVAEGTPRALRAAFRDEVYELVGGDRDELIARLDACADVLDRSPAGARLRVVVRPGGAAVVRELGARSSAEMVPARPTFEDVFVTYARSAASSRASTSAPHRADASKAS